MPFQLSAVNDDIDYEKKLPMIYRYASQCSKMLLMMLSSHSHDVVLSLT
jgi:hypothetical protein